jgi:hypothetical protein
MPKPGAIRFGSALDLTAVLSALSAIATALGLKKTNYPPQVTTTTPQVNINDTPANIPLGQITIPSIPGQVVDFLIMGLQIRDVENLTASPDTIQAGSVEIKDAAGAGPWYPVLALVPDSFLTPKTDHSPGTVLLGQDIIALLPAAQDGILYDVRFTAIADDVGGLGMNLNDITPFFLYQTHKL